MSISAYIRSNPQLSVLDFAMVYTNIVELIADGRLKWDFGDDV